MTNPKTATTPSSDSSSKHSLMPGSRPIDDPAHYIPDSNLIEAVRVALILEQPLLLTGEPGTGKTQLASYVAWSIQRSDSPFYRPDGTPVASRPLMFETKSTSTSRDLFYTYDTVARFHAAQTGEGSQRSADYLTYNAFGNAILHTQAEEEIRDSVPAGFMYMGKQRFVVVIDEIDKAPRDFPNDILNEVEGMYFRIPELQNRQFQASAGYRPVLILTSNSERNLPDAFLRRCIYYHIPFPEKEQLVRIIQMRIAEFGIGMKSTSENPISDVANRIATKDVPLAAVAPMLADALDLFLELRSPASGLQKKPATAELLGWLRALLAKNVVREEALRASANRDLIRPTLCALIKTSEDQKKGSLIINEWLKAKTA